MCDMCGVDIIQARKGKRRKFCDTCRLIRKREAYREASKDPAFMERRREQGRRRRLDPNIRKVEALYQKRYRKENKDFIKNSLRQKKEDNPEEFKKRRRNRQRKLLRESLQYRISQNLQTRLSTVVRKYSCERKISAIRDLGCSLPKLIEYLEFKFENGMTWENYGEWHIDHIKPLASFDLTKEEEQRKACHYTNLQPLWREDNLSKGAKPWHVA